jgi:hypothetical protein
MLKFEGVSHALLLHFCSSWYQSRRSASARRLTPIAKRGSGNGDAQNFPPEGVEVLSWYVMMGIGQVVTLKFPAEKLRDINVLIEREAWGAYRTEFYPPYDYRALYKKEQSKNP